MSSGQGGNGKSTQSEINGRRLLIIHMGYPPDAVRTRLGDQSDWFADAIGANQSPMVARPFLGEPLPSIAVVGAAIITGSWSMVTDREPWSERTAAWIREAMAADLPLLGVCYGHQLMADALGGTVDFHPAGREIGMREITLAPEAAADPLLGALPRTLSANLTHEQSVLHPPAGATVLGRSDHDPYQILRYGPHAWSVQFHPEFTPEIMAACLERGRRRYTSEGYDVDALVSALRPTIHSQQLLQSFVDRYADSSDKR